MRYEYKPQNICSKLISFDIDGNVISNIEFYGGCNGNLKAIAKLLDGATVEDISAGLCIIKDNHAHGFCDQKDHQTDRKTAGAHQVPEPSVLLIRG